MLGVSGAGYDAWVVRPLLARAQADEALLRRIRTMHLGARQPYGSPRVQAEMGLGAHPHDCPYDRPKGRQH